MNFPERIFFVTSVTAERRLFFSCERAAQTFLDSLFAYRDKGVFQLYEFVVMPDHIHLILEPSPNVSLEKAMQFIKGGFSHRYAKETGSRSDIWERGFTNHRIRDLADYEKHREYVQMNPVRAGLAETTQDYPYSSACPTFAMAPPRLKPVA